MTTSRLTDFRALSFDCYGTLIDWETGIWDALQPLLLANGHRDLRRAPALAAYATLEHEQEAATPGFLYPEVLRRVHAAFAERFGLRTTAALDADFGRSVAHWPAFADTADTLRQLATRFELIILSNIDHDSFAASNRKLGVTFDAIYTAAEIGSYKPDPANFEFMLTRLREDRDLAPSDLLHTAQSLFHDHVPAKQRGLATAWIDRQRLSEGGDWGATARVADPPTPDFHFFSLAELAAAVRAEDASPG